MLRGRELAQQVQQTQGGLRPKFLVRPNPSNPTQMPMQQQNVVGIGRPGRGLIDIDLSNVIPRSGVQLPFAGLAPTFENLNTLTTNLGKPDFWLNVGGLLVGILLIIVVVYSVLSPNVETMVSRVASAPRGFSPRKKR